MKESITPTFCPVGSSCFADSVNQCGLKNHVIKTRIVGGNPTDPYEFPWIVQVKKLTQKAGFCAGSIITNRHVITAGHCVEKKRAAHLLVSVSDHLTKILDTYENNMRVSRIYRHPKHEKFENDLAILQLENPITFSEYVKPICLPKKGNPFLDVKKRGKLKSIFRCKL